MKEYKVLEVKIKDAEEKMNDMTKEGWEVISTDIHIGGMAFTTGGTPMIITFCKEI